MFIRSASNLVRHLVIAALIAVPSIGVALAQGATVSLTGSAGSGDCAGGFATLNGSGDAITFRNACSTLTVNGSGNTVQVELTSGGLITLNGSGNRVSYVPIDGGQNATVADHGQGNAVTRMAALPGGTTTITGSTASPSGVTVQGPQGEVVQIGPNGLTAVPGVNQPGSGVVINPGGIAVTPGVTTTAPAIAAAPGQLMLSGDRQNRDIACGGASVFISGDHGQFTLRGGCKAVFVRGDHDIIHVELTPGAQIAIQGDNALVYFLLTSTGPDPAFVVTGEK